MKIGLLLGILVSVAGVVEAYDNCYLHDRGSEAWLACKEQALPMEEWRRRNDQNLSNQIYSSNQQAAQSLHDDELTLRILAEVQRQKKGKGK